jgi:1-acyl-sn-glycerol-3-phosphate acyltransferase
MLICNHKLILKNRDKWPKKPRGIIVANHASHFDVPAVFIAAPVPIFYIAKKELKNIPFLGWYMQLTGMIFIDRRNAERARDSMKKAGETILKGRTVISFPEGTRSKTGELSTFRKGSFQLAMASKVPVYPLCLIGTHKALKPGSFEIKPGRFEAIYCSPFLPEDFENWTPDKFALECKNRIQEAMSGENKS